MAKSYPDDWLADYEIRRAALHDEVMAIGRETFEFDSRSPLEGNWCGEAGRKFAREKRLTLQNPFCLVLWSAGLDEELFAETLKDESLDRDDFRGLLRYKAGNFRPRIGTLTYHLDRFGLLTLVIWPDKRRNPPEEPLVISPLNEMNMWFYFFSVAIELARAIVIEGNYGKALLAEMRRIHEVGLDGRVLLYDNNGELYRMDDDRRWTLDDIEEAVAFATGEPVRDSG